MDKNLSKYNIKKTALSSTFYFENVLFLADQLTNMSWNGFYLQLVKNIH